MTMDFGDRLRQLRKEKSLTQPELAEVMGIEQSYLSKLENGKSLPSNDMLQRILDAFDLEVSDLVDGLDQGVRNQLRRIPLVGDYLNRQKQLLIGSRRRWLLISALLASFGAALIYAGNAHLFFPDVQYQYVSKGILRDGESKELFEHPAVALPQGVNREQRDRIMNAIYARLDEDYVRTTDYRGTIYNVPVDGGSRTYVIVDQRELDNPSNKAVVFIGVLLLTFGTVGIVLDRKLSYS